jgi:hypothetical protein
MRPQEHKDMGLDKTTREPTGRASVLLLTTAYIALHASIAWSIPSFEPAVHNDDWTYSFAVQKLCDEGKLQLHRLTGPLSLPQVLAGWAVCEVWGGFSYSALRAMMVVHGIVPVWLLWALLRRLNFTHGQATLGTLLFLVNPITVSLTWSFHTDLIYLSFLLGALLAGLRAEESQRATHVAWSTCLLALACLTRQGGIYIAAALALYWCLKRKYRWALSVLSVVPLTLLVERWLTTQSSLTYLPFAKGQIIGAVADMSVGRLIYCLMETVRLVSFLGLLLLPLLLTWRQASSLPAQCRQSRQAGSLSPRTRLLAANIARNRSYQPSRSPNHGHSFLLLLRAAGLRPSGCRRQAEHHLHPG